MADGRKQASTCWEGNENMKITKVKSPDSLLAVKVHGLAETSR